MNELPLVSVVIPTKNSSEFLEECLWSAKNQTYGNLEVIVVDNFSTDKTLEIAAGYAHKYYKKGPERSAQRNFGAKKCGGKYVLFIDSDMKLDRNVVASCVEKIEADGEIKAIIIPEESFGVGFWARCKKLEKSFYVGVDWMEGARFFRKKSFEEAGGYDESMVSGEDWDLSQRIGKDGRIGRVSELIHHNEGKVRLAGTVAKKFYYAKEFGKYLRKEANKNNIRRQAGVVDRYKLFLSRPEKLFADPAAALGMLFMKTCEFGFGAIGFLLNKYLK